MDAQQTVDILKAADVDLKEAAVRIVMARKRLAAADRKYQERLKALR